MSDVVRFSREQVDAAASAADQQLEESLRDSQVPIEFAVGKSDRTACLEAIARYGVIPVQIRVIRDEPDAVLYLISVNDAIWLNKKILEEDNISDEEVKQRVDLIQMLENINLSLMETMWESFTRQSSEAYH